MSPPKAANRFCSVSLVHVQLPSSRCTALGYLSCRKDNRECHNFADQSINKDICEEKFIWIFLQQLAEMSIHCFFLKAHFICRLWMHGKSIERLTASQHVESYNGRGINEVDGQGDQPSSVQTVHIKANQYKGCWFDPAHSWSNSPLESLFLDC